MNNTFLVHVSKTISRSKFNNVVASQLQTPTQQQAKRTFSSTPKHGTAGVSLWGGEALKQSLQSSPSHSVMVMLQPLRTAASVKRQFIRSVSTQAGLQLHERDPNGDDPVNQGKSNNGGGEESSSGGGHGSQSGGDGGNNKPPPKDDHGTIGNQLEKPTVPEIYPQVLALPIARRPLFPGFYKAVVVKDPSVTAAIKELLKRGQPYVGAFLLKDENVDVDTIQNLDQVHRVGVFAQITSVFPASSGKDGKDEDAGLTAVLYPHRRIKIKELVSTTTSPTSLDQQHASQVKFEVEEEQAVVKQQNHGDRSLDAKPENVVPGEELMSGKYSV